MQEESRKKKVIIIGAGISGLAAGWFLKQRFGDSIDLAILEKSGRVGGWIRTISHEGFLFEQGPRGFRPVGKGEETLFLVRALGLENELIGSNTMAKKRYICLNGKLEPASLKLLLKKGLLKALWRDWRTAASPLEDESIADFCLRRFHPSILDAFIDPFVKGVFGGDAHQLSCRSCFPSLWNLEKQHGSIFRGLFATRKKKKGRLPSLCSFKEGMESLPRALAKALGQHIHLSTPVMRIQQTSSFLRLHLSEERFIDADLILAAVPAPTLATLYPTMASEFSCTSLTTINCGWQGDLLTRRGYGFLIPSKEKESILGMTWDSDIFPQHNQGLQTRVCVMMKEENQPIECALEGIRRHLGIYKKPDALLVGQAKQAIPQYTLGHFKRVEKLKQIMPPSMLLLGNSYEGVSVNDCMAHARQVVEGLSLSQ